MTLKEKIEEAERKGSISYFEWLDLYEEWLHKLGETVDSILSRRN